jgi:general stress protein YciG
MTSSNQGNKGASKGSGQGAKSERGFAAMDPDRQREIASEGGKAAHQSGNAHEFNSEEARKAGRKGGQASGSNQRSKQR